MASRIRIRKGWMDEGKEGSLLANPIQVEGGQRWAVVQWDNEDDPSLHKTAGLDIAEIEWKKML